MTVVPQTSFGRAMPGAKWLPRVDSRSRRRVLWRYIEATLLVGVFVALSYGLGRFIATDVYRHTDTTQLVTFVDSTGRFGVPWNWYGGSLVEAARLWGTAAATTCMDALLPGPGAYPNPPFSHLEYHAYYFVYALAPFTWSFSSGDVVGVSQAIAMVLVPVIAYLILRQERVNPIGALLFVAIIAAWPVWNGPFVQDLYMDRFFPPLALLYFAILYYGIVAPRRPWARFWPWAIPVGILAASTNDRSIIYTIGINVAIVMLMGPRAWLRPSRAVLALAAGSAALAAFFFYYLRFVHTSDLNTISTAVGSWTAVVDMLRNPAPFRFDQTYAELSIKFLVFNAVLFGIWGFFRFSLMLVALAAMLPNILTSVGGAEKVSFGLEYHTTYEPIVLFAAILGFAAVWRRLAHPAGRVVIAAVASLLALGLLILNPYKPGWSFDPEFLSQSGFAGVWRYYDDGDASSVLAHRRELDALAAAVPRDATVTVMDNLSPPFYRERGLYYYPVGIDVSDYAVLSIEKGPNGTTYYGGAVNYTGEIEKLNQCLTQRLERDGYNVADPVTVGPYAILKRG